MNEVASRQRGVISHPQLLAIGLSHEQVARWVYSGRLHGIHEGVYAVGHTALTRSGFLMAAVLAGGEGAVLSHLSAAAHLGLRHSSASVVEVMVPRRGERSRSGIRFHRPKVFGPEDVFVSCGIPCTTVARTLVDVAGLLRYEALERAVEQSLIEEMFDLRAVTEVLARISRPRGVRNLRRCIGAETFDGAFVRSRLERRFLRLVQDAGLPRPLVNQHIELTPGHWHKADFLWPATGVVIETDGYATHGNPIAFRRDRRLDRQMRAAGFRPERLTWDDVANDPAAVAAWLRSLPTGRSPAIEGRLNVDSRR